MKPEIIPFKKKYTPDFKKLNLEWLNNYFYVEALDKEVLENPEKHIIAPGGHIFLAKISKEIVGTIALMKHREGTFELTKMAVSPKHQGKKIGQQLLEKGISFAKEQDWETLLLYSNRKLENAIYLYKKFGFKEVALEPDNPYDRGNIKMLLEL